MGKKQMGMQALVNSEISRTLMILPFLLTLASLAANAAESSRPISIKATCDGKISSAAVAILRQEIGNSQKYVLVPTLSDNGKMDVVLTIDMNCTERDQFAAIATVYGRAKCFGVQNCHMAIDGSSIRSDLCNSSAVEECGQALFKAFDDYVNNPLAPRLNLN